LPPLGVGAKTGLGMHDLHVLRVCCAPAATPAATDDTSAATSATMEAAAATVGTADGDVLTTRHVLSFPAVGYIQKGKPNTKALTFSSDVATPAVLIVDSEEGLNVYECNTHGIPLQRGPSGDKYCYGATNSKMSSVARQSTLDLSPSGTEGVENMDEGEVALGFQVVGRRMLALTHKNVFVFNPSLTSMDAPDTASPNQDIPMRLPNGMIIPEHLLDDW